MSDERPLISVVAGARPNFMKVGPVIRALTGRSRVQLVHTGQHYDENMSAAFFRDLDLPEPDINLNVGSGTHGEQTAAVLVAYERILMEHRPDAVIVVGDVNSSLAASLAASKLDIPVAHVEAGLRSGDWQMPEEVNRVLTDRLSRWLFTPSKDGDENLAAEGIPADRVHLVGNVMADTLFTSLERAGEAVVGLLADHELKRKEYGVVTLHRPSSVDDREVLGSLIGALDDVSQQIPLVFPVHPRTAKRMEEADLATGPGVTVVEPLGYLPFLGLIANAGLVLTDSGGLQEETSILGVPCLTLRDSTERPITATLGTNRVVGHDRSAIVLGATEALGKDWTPAQIPYWDGHAGERIADILLRDLG